MNVLISVYSTKLYVLLTTTLLHKSLLSHTQKVVALVYCLIRLNVTERRKGQYCLSLFHPDCKTVFDHFTPEVLTSGA